MEKIKTIVMVLRSGKDFNMNDVELLAYHINDKWKSTIKPKILCMFDKVDEPIDFGNFELIPLPSQWRGTWSRISLYSPEMEKYKPFLYIDLDTAIIRSLEVIFDLVEDETKFITLEDFYQHKQLATGLVWFPKDSQKTKAVWEGREKANNRAIRMDPYIRDMMHKPDLFWQELTDTIIDFKPATKQLLKVVPDNAVIVCFHGKPRIFNADVEWVKKYVEEWKRS